MKLEILIVSIIFVVFLSLNFLAPNINNTSTNFISHNDTNALNNNTNSITDTEFILEQIRKSNSTNKDITNLSKKNELIQKEELEKSNQLFIKLVNDSIVKKNETNNSNSFNTSN